MTKSKNAPYSWDEIEADIRDAIEALVSINVIAGQLDFTIDPFFDESGGLDDLDGSFCDTDDGNPLEKYRLHRLAIRAYDYAYQLGEIDHVAASPGEPFHEESYDILMLLQGFPRTNRHGDISPFDPRMNSPLRNMFETACARYDLQQESELTIRQLALLSNMTILAVRSSISKDGIKTEPMLHSKEALKTMPEDERLGRVSSENASIWLRGRRSFIPTIDLSNPAQIELMWPAFLKPGVDIRDGIMKALKILQVTVSELAEKADVEAGWLEDVFGDGPALPDVDALQRVAKVMCAPAPTFVGGMVQDILTRQDVANKINSN